jgi:hypothetical protein
MASTTAEADWAAYLNTVAGANMKAIVYFPDDPSPWTDFDNAAQGRFLKWAAANNPPALYAFYLVDEPFHTKHNPPFTTETLQRLYQHARQLAPNVPMLVQYSREIAVAESQGDTQHAFSSGQCDLCAISTLEFSTQRGACNLDTGTLKSNHANSRRIIKAQAPDAQIWTTAEVFGAVGGGEYCMGDSSSVQQMADLLFSNQLQSVGQLSGIIWQFWASPSTTQDAVQDTLGDSQFGAQRDVVKATAQRLGLPVPAP